MNNISLKELGAQYLQEADKIRERIALLKEQLNNMPESERHDLLIRIHFIPLQEKLRI